jgi:hypothetical protein
MKPPITQIDQTSSSSKKMLKEVYPLCKHPSRQGKLLLSQDQTAKTKEKKRKKKVRKRKKGRRRKRKEKKKNWSFLRSH